MVRAEASWADSQHEGDLIRGRTTCLWSEAMRGLTVFPAGFPASWFLAPTRDRFERLRHACRAPCLREGRPGISLRLSELLSLAPSLPCAHRTQQPPVLCLRPLQGPVWPFLQARLRVSRVSLFSAVASHLGPNMFGENPAGEMSLGHTPAFSALSLVLSLAFSACCRSVDPL